jgi:O-acetyl-ADP-ribose deacetylase (regulator of RNase III)
MASGVALKVKELYPDAYQSDVENSSYGDRGKLGTFTHARVKHYLHGTPLMVINLYTQYNFGTHQLMLDYNALRSGMQKVMMMFGENRISMPRIGSGLAGGDWIQIENILNQSSGARPINVYSL